MALVGYIRNLFADKEKTIPVFPRTKVSAISDDSGVGLDALLDNISVSFNTVSQRITETNTNLQQKATTAAYTGTLSSSGWSSSAPYTQSITVSGILGTDNPFVDLELSNVADSAAVIEAWNLVGRVVASADGVITAYCYEDKPTVNVPILLKVVR